MDQISSGMPRLGQRHMFSPGNDSLVETKPMPTQPIRDLPIELKKLFLFLLAVTAAVVVLFLPLSIVAQEQRILAVVTFMLLLFITQAVPLAITGLMGGFSFWFLCGEPFRKAFSGFADTTPWFVLAALLLGTIAVNARLPDRLAKFILDKCGNSYGMILGGMIALNFILTPLIAAGAAKVVVLCTIALGIIKGAGIDIKSNISRGMILVVTYTATIFDKTIIAGAASILSRGIIEDLSGVSISWGKWFVAYAPTDIITMAGCWYLCMKMFPPEYDMQRKLQDRAKDDDKANVRAPLTTKQKTSIVLLSAAILLWATDVFHGIHPAAIGIGIALIAFIPGIGVLGEKDFNAAHFPLIIFIASAIGMGKMLTDTHVLMAIGNTVFGWLEPLIPYEHLLAAGLYGAANVFHLFLGNEPALLSATLPLVLEFAKTHGLHPETVGMLWVFAAGGKLFIYQSGVLAVGYSFGAFSARDLLKLGAGIIILEGINIALITPLYWTLLGLTFR